MESSDYLLAVETQSNFDEAVISVLKTVDKKGWTVFQIYDLRERMVAKGFDQKPLKIIEICSAKHSNKILSKNRYASLCMPCRINIIDDNNKIRIIAMKPSVMPIFFQEITQTDITEIEKDITNIINEARE
ncbi:MAG: DUF302 domain-containing protein [Nanoarchaeota archaeon]